MTDPLRVGIIGTGFGARVHAPHLQDHPAFAPVAIASVHRGDPERIRRLSGIDRVYLDWREMLAQEDLDLVVVAAGPLYHREMTRAALAAGRHVLCEKPMAMDAQEALEMLRAQEAAGKIGAITFEFRFRPARQAVQRLLQDGAIGQVYHLAFRGTGAGLRRAKAQQLGWLGSKAEGGGMLGALGSHMVDGIRTWLRDEVAELSAQLAIHVPEPDDRSERRTADDAFQIVGRMRQGATFLAAYQSSAHKAGWNLEVHGSEGSILMRDDAELLVQRAGAEPSPVELPQATPPAWMEASAASYYSALRPFLDTLAASIAAGSPAPDLPSLRDGVASQEILDAARRADAEGRKVALGVWTSGA